VKPSIYNEYEALTREAADFETELEILLRPVFEKAQEQFLVRDIAAMIHDVTSELAAVTVLKNALNRRTKEMYCPDCSHRWIEHRETILASPHKYRCEHVDGTTCCCTADRPHA
jgi:hypothetical protein